MQGLHGGKDSRKSGEVKGNLMRPGCAVVAIFFIGWVERSVHGSEMESLLFRYPRRGRIGAPGELSDGF